MKISIIGAGNVGGLSALHLCSYGAAKLVLVDIMPRLASAKALDLSDARFLFRSNCSIQGTDDINQIADSEIVVITAGLTRKPGMKREELAQKNGQIIREICKDIKRHSPQSIVIVVTNPLDAMTYLAIKETGFTANRVLGMGLSLDCSRLANLISEASGICVTEIEPCIIGSHGEGMLPLARYTKVKGKALTEYLESEKISELFQRTLRRGAEIVSLLESGSAYFAPSAAISELVKAIVQDEKKVLPASVYLNGEYGLRDICIGLPCCIGKDGVEKIVELELTDDEKLSFLKAAESIRQQASVLAHQSLKGG